MKVLELNRNTVNEVIKLLEEGDNAVVLFTADYGCAECEVLEELIESHGLWEKITMKVIITHEDESVETAFDLGVLGIPLVVIKKNGAKHVLDDLDVYKLFEKLAEHVEEGEWGKRSA